MRCVLRALWGVLCGGLLWLQPTPLLRPVAAGKPGAATKRPRPKRPHARRWTYRKGYYLIRKKKGLHYRLRDPGKAWRVVPLPKNDIAFYSRGLGAALQSNMLCGPAYRKLSHGALRQQLFKGFKSVSLQREISTSGAQWTGLFTHFNAQMDGVKIAVALMIIKRGDCVFDLSLIAPPQHFQRGIVAFDALVKHFHIFPKQPPARPTRRR